MAGGQILTSTDTRIQLHSCPNTPQHPRICFTIDAKVMTGEYHKDFAKDNKDLISLSIYNKNLLGRKLYCLVQFRHITNMR